MSDPRGYFVVLLAKLLTGVSSGISKSVCIGETTLMFENLTFSSLKTKLFLYRNDSNTEELIARWSIPKDDKDPQPIPTFRNRLFFDDRSGYIFLEQFRLSDESKYFIKYDINGVPMTDYVKINALVAPEENCRPIIQPNNDKTILFAFVETDVCGRPPLSIQWQNSTGISSITSTFIKLPHGKEAGTYSACMNGLALRCVNATKLNYCSNCTIEKKHPPLVLSYSLDQTKWWYVLLAAILTMIVAAIIIVILWWKMKKPRSCALQNEAFLHASGRRSQKLEKQAPENNSLLIGQELQGRTTDTSQG